MTDMGHRRYWLLMYNIASDLEQFKNKTDHKNCFSLEERVSRKDINKQCYFITLFDIGGGGA